MHSVASGSGLLSEKDDIIDQDVDSRQRERIPEKSEADNPDARVFFVATIKFIEL